MTSAAPPPPPDDPTGLAQETADAHRRSAAHAHPPYDAELAVLVADGAVDGHSLRTGDIARLREVGATWKPHGADLARDGAVWFEERQIPGRHGHPDVPVVLLWPTTPYTSPRPVLVACHGGGMVAGEAHAGAPDLAEWVADLGVVVVSPGYRLAPEHPYPAALDDVMTALMWLHDDAAALGIDPENLGIYGISAGACLAAAATLRCRDEGQPGPAYQILQDPMLDDRHHRPSTYEHIGIGVWDRISSQTAWNAYLAGAAGAADVSPYAAPGRAADDHAALAGLPPTFLDIGTADLFRDDALAYGTALARAGVPIELHLWPGGWHGFSEMAPDTALGRTANATRTRYLADRIRSARC